MDEGQQEALPIGASGSETLPEADVQIPDASTVPAAAAAADIPAAPKKRGRKAGSTATKAANADGAASTKAKSSVVPGAPSRPGHTAFPVSKVAKIIKADKDIPLVQKEATFLMSVATVSSSPGYYHWDLRLQCTQDADARIACLRVRRV